MTSPGRPGGRGRPPQRGGPRTPARANPGRANPGRVAAVRTLASVDAGAHAEEALVAFLTSSTPEPDRGLAWHLVFGVLRHRSELDAALRPLLRQPLDALDGEVRAALRVGAFEILLARTSTYAAVDQAVEAARAAGAGRASGLVNAILRRVGPPDTLSRAEALNHPAWLVARWDARYGADATEAWCRANGAPPPLFVVARDDVDAVQARFAETGLIPSPASIAGEAVPGVLDLGPGVGRVEALPGFDDGAWWVQDAASAWVSDLVGPAAGTLLDACAAPGGKTLRHAAAGWQVTAADVAPERLDALHGSLERLRLQAPVVVHDWTRGPCAALGAFDAVLVDAPCTGLGTVRRHPEIRWRRGPFDPAQAAARQAAILRAAATHVRPGGALVYMVCSPEPEEGEQVVQAFVADNPAFTVAAVRATAPPTGGEDAFWGARLVRA
ncbi:MAG: MFS transporter [Alphaproteobacteria bacterium]|nr:MFS transporter [Alphaproteobacteria bacterium]